MIRTSDIDPHYVSDRLAFSRRRSRPVMVGGIQVGGDAGVVLQSMTTTPTQDVVATVAQSIRLAEAGCEIVRITAPTVKDAKALQAIRTEFTAAGFGHVPLVADIHFMPAAAMEAVEHVEKVRVNPGNYADRKHFKERDYTDSEYAGELERIHERFSPLVLRAKELGRAMRIGVNHGSLSDRIMNRFGDTPAGMVESAMEFIHVAEDHGYRNIIISMKSSNPKVMVHAYRLLVRRLQDHGEAYPLHLGVTEAGDGEDGRIKGAAGIGTLLCDGIGDTIRVSLTEEPEAEIPVAQELGAWADGLEPTTPVTAPLEAVDPYDFRRRVGEIVRLGGAEGLPVGGGAVPQVLSPLRIPADDDAGVPADAVLDVMPATDVILQHPPCDRHEPVPVAEWDGVDAVPDASVVLLRPAAADPAASLRDMLAALPGDRLIGLASFPLGVMRSYRLLAAVDEELFTTAERASVGTGVRHALVLADGDQTDYLQAAVQFGGLLIDGVGDAIFLPRVSHPLRQSFAILQAVKARQTRADFVACPSCGRTLFDLMTVTEHIKEATAHLDGVTIAIMGCIVNGPGEMADADFGYVGSGEGVITLYRGREPVRRNIPMAAARDQLIELIKEHGMWKEPEEDASCA